MSLNKFTIQKSFAISAGAGSGKTYTLSRRYINALLGFDYFREDYETDKSYFEDLKPAKVNQIVTITYTEAAALEMKGRIFGLVAKIIHYDELWKAELLKRQDSNYKKDDDFESIAEANSFNKEHLEYIQTTLKQAYTDSSNSKISTIHSYCLDIIKANADIAKMDTKLDIIKDDEKEDLLSKIIFTVLNDAKNKELVLDISSDISMFFMDTLISKYVSSSKFRQDFDSFRQGSIDVQTYKELILELYPLPDVTDALEELKDNPVVLKWFENFYKNFTNFDAKPWKEVQLDEKTPTLGVKKFPLTDPIKKAFDNAAFLSVYSYIDADREDLFYTKVEKLKTLLNQIKDSYDRTLLENNKIDFDTIILKTLELIPHASTNFKYIMVDEFQDTNATQFEIIKRSRNEKTNLFVVGDAKQSIYSFQGAEIEVFNTAVNDSTIFSSLEDMSRNYRSDRVVLDTVNTIFNKRLEENTSLTRIKPNYEAQAKELTTKKDGGSFKFLITKSTNEEINELDTIAQFISEVSTGIKKEYLHITQKIQKQEKAIAIVFDSKTKMLELKLKLKERGIVAKVSASDNFYHTKEVNDIFNVLKAILFLSKPRKEIGATDKYYIAGALRSNILRFDDNVVKVFFDSYNIPKKLQHYIDKFHTLTLAQLVKYIYDDSNIIGVYTHFDDIEQRVANLYKFLSLCQEFDDAVDAGLDAFLSLIENAIYFSEESEESAFFKSDSTKSIEICSIHSTKGLAYPLVLLGNSDKGLNSQITSDSIKHNNFTLEGENEPKQIVGFKINNYTPLSHRVLKAIDKLKHMAEKKRLLYVALTRAEHDVVVSGYLKQKKDGAISLREDSYLSMMCDALTIPKENLFDANQDYLIEVDFNNTQEAKEERVSYVEHAFKPLTFKEHALASATNTKESSDAKDTSAAALGTSTHKIIELYWDSFRENQEAILDKMMIFKTAQREALVKNMDSFYKSDVYELLKNGVEHRFELEFNVDGKTGFIDFIYFDENQKGWIIVDFKTGIQTDEKNNHYQGQLDFYTNIVNQLQYKVVGSRLLWLSK